MPCSIVSWDEYTLILGPVKSRQIPLLQLSQPHKGRQLFQNVILPARTLIPTRSVMPHIW